MAGGVGVLAAYHASFVQLLGVGGFGGSVLWLAGALVCVPLACAGALSLGAGDIVATVAIFLVGELVLSRWLYKLRLRDRPY